jgi:hypothetical protein
VGSPFMSQWVSWISLSSPVRWNTPLPRSPSAFPHEHRPEHDGSSRLLSVVRIGEYRRCDLRMPRQKSHLTVTPRRIRAVFWPRVSHPPIPSTPILEPPQPLPPPTCPVLWREWPRCRIRRNCLKMIGSEIVVLSMGPAPPPLKGEHMITRAERAVASQLASTPGTSCSSLHRLPATCAHLAGCVLLTMAYPVHAGLRCCSTPGEFHLSAFL